MKGVQWIQVQKSGESKQNNRSKGKGAVIGNEAPPIEKFQGEGSLAPQRVETSCNPFEILSTPEEPPNSVVEEVGQQPTYLAEDKFPEETNPL